MKYKSMHLEATGVLSVVARRQHTWYVPSDSETKFQLRFNLFILYIFY